MKIKNYKEEELKEKQAQPDLEELEKDKAIDEMVIKERKPEQKPRRRFRRVLLIIILVLLFLFLLFYLFMPSRFNILFVGSDQRDEVAGKRSDSLMVLSIPRSPKKKISLVTIPRDSRVLIDGYEEEEEKITHAYGYGDEAQEGVLGNIMLTKKEVGQLLGIPIHGTVEFTFESFENLIDHMGGVDTETYGLIDGERALERSRNRFREGGDFARTADQREIFMSLFKRMKDPSEALKAYNFMEDHDQTRFKINKTRLVGFGLATVIRRFGKLSVGDVGTDFVPGYGETIYSEKFGQNMYFWVIDQEGKREVVERLLK